MDSASIHLHFTDTFGPVSAKTNTAKAATPSRGRSASAAPKDKDEPIVAAENGDTTMQVDGDVSTAEAGAAPKTPARRGKRRMSEVPEEGAAVPASTRTLRTRAKTPVKEEPAAKATPARKRKEPTPGPSAAKRPRVSALPKPPKIGLNPLPEPYAVFSSIPKFSFDYKLPGDYDPRNGKHALTVLVAGDGTFGVLGLGEEVDRLSKFKRHKWFHDSITAVTENGDSEMNGETTQKLSKDGIVEIVCGGMHTLALDADGKVRRCMLSASTSI